MRVDPLAVLSALALLPLAACGPGETVAPEGDTANAESPAGGGGGGSSPSTGTAGSVTMPPLSAPSLEPTLKVYPSPEINPETAAPPVAWAAPVAAAPAPAPAPAAAAPSDAKPPMNRQ